MLSAGEMMGLEAPKWDTEMTHLCAVRARAWEAEAWMMSFGGLCSAWSVSHWLHLDSPLEEFNLHHTPRRPTLLFLSKCFHRHHPVRNPPHHSSSRTDSSGDNDGCALSFQKAKYDFQFFFRGSSVYCGCTQKVWRGDAVSELLTQWRADSDPICQRRESYPSPQFVRVCLSRLCQGDAPS